MCINSSGFQSNKPSIPAEVWPKFRSMRTVYSSITSWDIHHRSSQTTTNNSHSKPNNPRNYTRAHRAMRSIVIVVVPLIRYNVPKSVWGCITVHSFIDPLGYIIISKLFSRDFTPSLRVLIGEKDLSSFLPAWPGTKYRSREWIAFYTRCSKQCCDKGLMIARLGSYAGFDEGVEKSIWGSVNDLIDWFIWEHSVDGLRYYHELEMCLRIDISTKIVRIYWGIITTLAGSNGSYIELKIVQLYTITSFNSFSSMSLVFK